MAGEKQAIKMGGMFTARPSTRALFVCQPASMESTTTDLDARNLAIISKRLSATLDVFTKNGRSCLSQLLLYSAHLEGNVR